MKPNSPPDRAVLWLIAAVVLLGCSGLWWLCCRDVGIPFLPQAGSADWIVYPKPPDTRPHRTLPLWAVFRRSFTLETAPTSASLSVRAFKHGTVRINGRAVDSLALGERDWKKRHQAEVGRFLRPGENEILVTASNLLGPPALWLSLKWDTQTLYSDPRWQVSLVGAAWQNAALAVEPPAIRPGNPLHGRELIADSLRRTWPVLLLIVSVSVALIIGSKRFLQARQYAGPARAGAVDRLAVAPLVVLGMIALSWTVLFGNNLPQLAALFGFDRDGHQQYIDYILQQKALPLADQGWQMYQPPLFYLLSALILGPLGWTASADAAVLALRAFSVVTGLVHLALIFLCLRRMFPDQPRRQIVGLLLAGYLPAHLCISHHMTNEGLAALFVTGALYFTLRTLRADTRALGLGVAIGICLGLALLSKFSAVLALPVVLGALGWKEVQGRKPEVQGAGTGVGSQPSAASGSVAEARRSGVWRATGKVALVFAACLAVCGWHYARVWRRFGNPLLGNWDPRLPFAWWQDPGCHTSAWFERVGEALTCPLFSSLSGFADGVYATLWGDGLCSGSAMMHFRPQWNYDLMNGGYLFSLLATTLLLIGTIVVLARFIRQPAPEDFLMLGMIFLFAAGVGLMTLRVASYAQVKAFYALPALFPLCVIATAGWDWLVRKGVVFRHLLSAGLLAWAITVYAAFWIRSGNAFTHTACGVGLADDGRYAEAAESFSRALRLDANSLPARVGLAEAWRRLGRRDEARQQAALALQQHPDEAEANIETAVLLGLDHQYAQAVHYLRKALAEAPDHPTVCQQLAACLAPMGAHQEVIETCRQGLRVDPFNPTLHHLLSVAAAELGDLTNAAVHLRVALALKPEWPEAHGALGFALTALGQLAEAASHYEAAIQERPDDARLHYLYAMTLASQGKAREAADHYRHVLNRMPDMVEALNNLAWILAANPSDALRDGADAVRLAERACELSQHGKPVLLGTLAAAYAEAGRFQDAVKTAEKARELATAAGLKEIAAKNSELLELYRAGKPYREPDAANR